MEKYYETNEFKHSILIRFLEDKKLEKIIKKLNPFYVETIRSINLQQRQYKTITKINEFEILKSSFIRKHALQIGESYVFIDCVINFEENVNVDYQIVNFKNNTQLYSGIENISLTKTLYIEILLKYKSFDKIFFNINLKRTLLNEGYVQFILVTPKSINFVDREIQHFTSKNIFWIQLGTDFDEFFQEIYDAEKEKIRTQPLMKANI